MSDSSGTWQNTTHDWAATVDAEHLAEVRRDPGVFAPGGTTHLILEVIAYAADEAEWTGAAGRCQVTLHADGSVSVADDGRGTDTRLDGEGQPVKKPVMATKDLRFYDLPDAQRLPDDNPRRGMSAVAALSSWLVHTNRRRNGLGRSGTSTAYLSLDWCRSLTRTPPGRPSPSVPRTSWIRCRLCRHRICGGWPRAGHS